MSHCMYVSLHSVFVFLFLLSGHVTDSTMDQSFTAIDERIFLLRMIQQEVVDLKVCSFVHLCAIFSRQHIALEQTPLIRLLSSRWHY